MNRLLIAFAFVCLTAFAQTGPSTYGQTGTASGTGGSRGSATVPGSCGYNAAAPDTFLYTGTNPPTPYVCGSDGTYHTQPTGVATDTNNVNGVPSATVASGAALGAAAVSKTATGSQSIASALTAIQVNKQGYSPDAFNSTNSPGIGVAQSAWNSATAYANCYAVSYSAANYLGVSSSTNVTPGTNSLVWYPVPNAGTPTATDCAAYTAMSLISGSTGQTLALGTGQYLTCIGLLLPNVVTAGYPTLNIIGRGKALTTLKQSCDISGTGNATVTLQPTSNAYQFASFVWRDLTVDASSLAVAPMAVYGAQQFAIENVDLLNAKAGSDHYLEFGSTVTANHSTSWVFEPAINNINLTSTIGKGHGAQLAVTTSGGVPTISIVSPGSQYGNPSIVVAYLDGVGASGNPTKPCTTMAPITLTIAGGQVTGATTTATGCVNTGSIYAKVYVQSQIACGVRFSDATDSHHISGITVGGIGDTAAICNNGGNLWITRAHPESTLTGILDTGGNNHYADTYLDSIFNYGFDIEATSHPTYVNNSLFYFNGTDYQPSAHAYYIGTTTAIGVDIQNDDCANNPPAGFWHIVTPNGAVDTGGASLPNFVKFHQGMLCEATGTKLDFIANAYNWGSGANGNYWSWNMASGYTGILSLTNGGGSAYTFRFLNNKAATSTTNQNSPVMGVFGTYWNGSANTTFGINQQLTFAAGGTNPAASYSFARNIAYGGPFIYTFDSAIAANGVSTVANGPAAGTSPGTATITGTNLAGVVTITTGTSPTSASTLATITLSAALPTAYQGCNLTPRNSISVGAGVFTTAPSTTAWTIAVGAVALAASTVYAWSYSCF